MSMFSKALDEKTKRFVWRLASLGTNVIIRNGMAHWSIK